LMYVDESGDSGYSNSPVRYFILSGLVIHELRWNNFIDDLINFRRNLRVSKGLKLREEIHASGFVNSRVLLQIKRNDRVDILKKCINWCAAQNDCSIINVVIDKTKLSNTADVFEKAWTLLIQRFENTINKRNFPGPANPDDKGLIIPDNTEVKKLTRLLRKMRRINYIPHSRSLYTGGSRNITLSYVIEDPFFKDSANSFIHQIVDVIAYCVRQLYEPNAYMKKKGGNRFFYLLNPVLCKHASTKHPYGIVEI
ncbi:MAG: DUF3800 domain-containing protein, partial [Ignavibacteria bacterium]